MVLKFFIGLVVVLTLALVCRREDGFKTAAFLAGNWLVCTGYAWVDGGFDTSPPLNAGADPRVLFAIDYVTAVLLVLSVNTRWPVVVGLIYAFQCVAHGARIAVADQGISQNLYLDLLSKAAWAQLLFVGAWIVGTRFGLWGGHRDPAHGALADQPLSEPLAREEASR